MPPLNSQDAITIFSWNTKNNRNTVFHHYLSKWLVQQKVDIVVLQESFNINLNFFQEVGTFRNSKGQRTVRIFLNNKSGISESHPTAYMQNKLRAVELNFPGFKKLTLFGVHLHAEFPPKNREDKHELNKELVKYINEFEGIVGHKKTIIAGDFNYRMHDWELQQPTFLNAIPDKFVIRAYGQRQWQTRQIPFFYNPMWNLMGDYNYYTGAEKPSGTYYWNALSMRERYANLFDGVLLRPPIQDSIHIPSLKIIEKIGHFHLVNFAPTVSPGRGLGVINKNFADHLPVMFKLDKTKI